MHPRRLTALLAVALATASAAPPIAAADPAPAASAATTAETAAGGGRAADVAEPDGFRGPPYRAPVPATLTGAEVIDTAAAAALWRSGDALFVDTLPTPRKPDNLPEGTLWRPKPREDIPGSIWLANTGYDRLSPDVEAYFFDALAAAIDGDLAATVVFYCLPDCWMSWNAAKRAVEAGYTGVKWFPGGTEAWADAGLPLERREPLPTSN